MTRSRPGSRPALSATLVTVMFAVDHPRLHTRTVRQTITLDRAYPSQMQLRAALEQLLGAEIQYVRVSELDMVRDTTVADVRFKVAILPWEGPLARHLSGRSV